MENTITYKQALELGFKRDDSPSDKIFFDKYGFKYFMVYLNIGKKYSMGWDVNNHKVTLYKNSNTFKKNLSIDEIKEYIKLLS